jgi:cell division protein FtsI/penicillin-binding protein 2
MGTWRTRTISFLFLILAATIVGRLFYLQVLNGKFYQSQALGQQAGFREIQGDRGEVFFENSKDSRGAVTAGEVNSLAINEDRWTMSAVPKIIKDKEAFAGTLSKYLSEDKQAILEKLNKSDSYVILKKDVALSDVALLKGLKLEGLNFESSPGRYYPQEKLASQVIGFLGGEGVGQYGIEGYYDDALHGKKGIYEEKKGFSAINSDNTSELNGANLFLTIDYNIQFQAESLLRQAHKDIDIEAGQIIVMKPDTGRVLAMANFPAFDPNNYSKETNLEIFQNSAVQKVFEPGSVFKPFIMAMALNEGKVAPETTYVDTGSYKIGKDTLYNFSHEKYGKRDMSGILEKSINTGIVFVSKTFSHDVFLSYLDKLGFNDKTGIDLQGETYSRNELLKKGSDFGFATSAFGQGIEMTPIQLVSAFSVFANGGKMVKPYLVEKIVQGPKETKTVPQVSDVIFTPQTVSEVTTMLTNVVERGFGSGAKIPGYYLSGKTGTAEVPIRDKKGYYNDRTIQSFIGYGPSLKPEFLILVKLDNPKVPKSSLSAAPIFKKLAQFIINYWQIPPDYDVATK